MIFFKKTLNQFKKSILKIKKLNKKIFYLNGPLGAGKTTFVKYFLDSEEVVSPTFSFCVEYSNAFHFDCYSSINYNALLSALETDKFIFIEWADKLTHKLPGNALILNLKKDKLIVKL